MNDFITNIIGNLLGLEKAQKIEGYEPAFGASWAREAPFWLLFGCLGLIAVAAIFYIKYQRQRHVGARVVLGILRATALCLLLLLLAEPILRVTVVTQKRPALYFLVDGTNSMAIEDELSEADRDKLAQTLGIPESPGNPNPKEVHKLTRADYVKALLKKEDDNLLERLQEKFRLRAFLFDRSEGIRSLDLSAAGQEEIDVKHLAEQVTTEGEVTALGAALKDLAHRHATANLAGLVIFSDFVQNAGPAALGAAKSLGVEIHTVGVGSTTAVDVAASVQAPLHIKKDERGTVTVTLRQQGLDGEQVKVTVSAELLGAVDEVSAARIEIGEKTVPLVASVQEVGFDYVPEKAGRFVLIAEVEQMPGEVVHENNRAQREITVVGDFLRLLFVEYEPTWEWRFIKEVFHRDKLVGIKGFRTFLRSSDPRVRESNEMFLPTMSPSRSEFFSYDVIFLGDVPASALSPTFCKRTVEFVKEFGGGLVILSGPRFGPGELAQTPLADLLPVTVAPGAGVNDRGRFSLKLARDAAEYDFMQLGDNPNENRRAWANLGLLQWYRPVEKLHPLATALAEHPTDLCIGSDKNKDKKQRQPLIAIRRFDPGGEVIYLAFNETWRLRRKHGERYYRQFWGQMIHRLGLSHALGSQKRFVVRTDRRRYQAEDQVLLTVEAYDSEFRPLSEEDEDVLPDRKLHAELVFPDRNAPDGHGVQKLSVSQLRKGVFETQFPVFSAGEHRIRVTDPITDKPVETTFQVTSVAVERQRAVRNVALQQQIAAATGGRTYDLTNVSKLADQIKLTPKTETNIEPIRLWNTWLCFACVVAVLLGEWLLRKRVNLP